MRGQTSCRCCNQGDITQELRSDIVELEYRLGFELESTSGARCLSNNMKCAGSPTSKHLIFPDRNILKCCACDLRPIDRSLSVSDVAIAAAEIFDGVGCYIDGWVHVDKRGYKARWIGWKGVYHPWPY